MDSSWKERAALFFKDRQKRKRWYQAVTAMASVVVFVTVYMLILPAITMSNDTICGKEAHKHVDSCYEMQAGEPVTVLNCNREILDIHTHTADCYDTDNSLICGMADYVIHEHDSSCCDSEGTLVCSLKEVKVHEHSSSCYKTEQNLICEEIESEGHSHSDSCYQMEKQGLTCTAEEHMHGEECYDENGELACTLEEHTHSDDCYHFEPVLICEKEEAEGHAHGDACYEEVRTLICGKEEVIVHEHTASCKEDGAYVCGHLETAEHHHADICFAEEPGEEVQVLICEKEEHEHISTCYPEETKEETAEESDSAQAEGGLMSQNPSQDEAGIGEEPGLYSVEEPVDFKKDITEINITKCDYNSNTQQYDVNVDLTFITTKETVEADGLEYYVDLGPDVVVPENLLGKVYDGRDDEGRIGFHYEFQKKEDGTYRILIHFDSEYVANAQDMEGHITFEGTVDKSHQNEKGEVVVGVAENTVTIPPEGITYPEDNTANYDMNVEKEGSFISENGETKLVYTVWVKSKKGTPSPIKLSDALTAEGIDVSAAELVSIEKYAMHDWGSASDLKDGNVSAQSFTTSGTSYQMELDGLGELECYKITYEYTIENLPEGTSVSADNKIHTEAIDPNTKEDLQDDAQKSVAVSKSSLTKKGQHDTSTGQISWTIAVNSSKSNIAGYTLTDDMFGRLKPEEISLSPASGYTINTDAEGYVTGITFNETADGVNYNTYTVTYKTTDETGWDNKTVVNNAALSDANGENAVETGPISVNVYSTGKVTKERGTVSEPDANGNVTVSWNAALEIPAGGIPAGRKLEDTISGTAWDSGDHWMSEAQAEELKKTLTAVFGSDYEITFKAVSGQNAPAGYGGFTVTFPNGLTGEKYENQTISFSYQTTVDISKISTKGSFTNKLAIDGREDNDTYTYNKLVSKLDGSGNSGESSVTTSDGTLTWKVRVALDQNYESLTVTDTLPEGVTLTGVKIGGEYSQSDMTLNGSELYLNGTSWPVSNMTAEGSCENNTVTLNIRLTDPAAGRPDCFKEGTDIWIIYTCKADAIDTVESGQSQQQTYTNNVTVSADDGFLGSDNQTQHATLKKEAIVVKELDKTHQWMNEDRLVHYCLELNTSAKNLAAGDTLTLEDVISFNTDAGRSDRDANLVQNSVKLYYAQVDSQGIPLRDENGKLIKGDAVSPLNWKWSYSTQDKGYNDISHTITAEIPDSTALILEYDYQVDMVIPEGWGSNQLGLTNVATLKGDSESSVEDKANDKWEERSTSAGITTSKQYRFYKVDETNNAISLDDAEFTLYKYNPESAEFENTGRIYKTKDGQFVIYWQNKDTDYQYEYNTAYYIQETKAPAGYALPADPPKYRFYFSHEDITTHPEKYPADWGDEKDLTTKTYYEYCANTPIPVTQVTVKKLWFHADGTEAAVTDGEVVLQLYQVEEGSTDTVGIPYGEPITLTSAPWTYTFSNLPVSYEKEENGNKTEISYRYYVQEMNGEELYDVAYETAEDGTLLVKNTSKAIEHPELPKTGGFGTWLYTAGGLLLILAALLIYIKKYHSSRTV